MAAWRALWARVWSWWVADDVVSERLARLDVEGAASDGHRLDDELGCRRDCGDV